MAWRVRQPRRITPPGGSHSWLGHSIERVLSERRVHRRLIRIDQERDLGIGVLFAPDQQPAGRTPSGPRRGSTHPKTSGFSATPPTCFRACTTSPSSPMRRTSEPPNWPSTILSAPRQSIRSSTAMRFFPNWIFKPSHAHERQNDSPSAIGKHEPKSRLERSEGFRRKPSQHYRRASSTFSTPATAGSRNRRLEVRPRGPERRG